MIKEGYQPEGKNLDPGDPPGQKTMTREEAIRRGELFVRWWKAIEVTEVDDKFNWRETLLSTAKNVEEGIDLIIPKMIWKRLKSGEHFKTIPIYREGELHHEFGDCPEEDIARVRLALLTEGRPEGKETKPPPTPLPSEGMSPRGSK